MLAGNLAAFEIEGVAVAVFGRRAENAGVPVLFEPAHLAVVGDVAPQQEPARGAPRRTLSPKGAGPKPLDGRVRDDVFLEALVERNQVGIGIAKRIASAPIPLLCLGGYCRERRGRACKKLSSVHGVYFMTS